MVEQAVNQSLELQQQWLNQWSERAGEKKLKPKIFAELSAEARGITKQWLDNQNELRDQWLQLLKGSGSVSQPDFAAWEKTVQESIERQMALLNDWSEKADFKKLSLKETGKLSEQIIKSMQKSIETQQQLWSPWFNQLGSTGAVKEAGKATKAAASSSKQQKKTAATKTKNSPSDSTQPDDDLKQIAGVGAGLEKKLKAAGITTLRQIAELSDADIADLEERIIRFSGRIKREEWVDQARKLIS
jgi:predicted flap endonuclease-1-like 5' DNA nuclease